MANDLVPRRFLFPSLLSSFWDDDDGFAQIPSTNGLAVSEDDKSVYVEAHLPGIDPKDVEVTLQDGYVWIRGEAKEEEENKKRKYYRQASRAFSYRVAVPADADTNTEPAATYKNGVMTVAFNKSAATQPKRIAVKTA